MQVLIEWIKIKNNANNSGKNNGYKSCPGCAGDVLLKALGLEKEQQALLEAIPLVKTLVLHILAIHFQVERIRNRLGKNDQLLINVSTVYSYLFISEIQYHCIHSLIAVLPSPTTPPISASRSSCSSNPFSKMR